MTRALAALALLLSLAGCASRSCGYSSTSDYVADASTTDPKSGCRLVNGAIAFDFYGRPDCPGARRMGPPKVTCPGCKL